VDGAYTSLGSDYVSIRYDYTPGYNTIATLDLYEYEQGPTLHLNRFIRSYTLEPGIGQTLALEDADSRLMTADILKGFRLEVVPMQSRSGEESPFNFFAGDSYFFKIDNRTNATSFQGVQLSPTLFSQLFLDNFTWENWEEKHTTVFGKVDNGEDLGVFDTFDYRYETSGTVNNGSPVSDDGFFPITSDDQSIDLQVVNAGGTFLDLGTFNYDADTVTPSIFNYTIKNDPEVFQDITTGVSSFSGPLEEGTSYTLRVAQRAINDSGANVAIDWATVAYAVVDSGNREFLPAFRYYDYDENRVVMEFEVHVPPASAGLNMSVYLSNPVVVPSIPATGRLDVLDYALINTVITVP
jgi:hypothetical protein